MSPYVFTDGSQPARRKPSTSKRGRHNYPAPAQQAPMLGPNRNVRDPPKAFVLAPNKLIKTKALIGPGFDMWGPSSWSKGPEHRAKMMAEAAAAAAAAADQRWRAGERRLGRGAGGGVSRSGLPGREVKLSQSLPSVSQLAHLWQPWCHRGAPADAHPLRCCRAHAGVLSQHAVLRLSEAAGYSRALSSAHQTTTQHST
ncbi:MAG: hypothetical protein WDW38_010960 [Sanguina aurantia]